MTAYIKVGNTWQTVTNVYVKAGGSWRTVTGLYVRRNNTWSPVIGAGGGAALSLSQLVSTVSGSISGAGTCTSSAATGVVTNGTGPFTYAWTKISGDTLTVTSPTAISTTFSSALTSGQTKSAVYRLTVTDSLSATAYADVTVNLSSSIPPPPPPPPPASLTVVISPRDSIVTREGSGDLGQSFSASVSGGNGSYNYNWSISGLTVTGATSPSCSGSKNVTPPTDETFGVSLSVTDTNGVSGNDSTSVRLISTVAPPPPPPPALSVSISPGSLFGSRIGSGTATTNTGTATATGGTPPYSYSWTFLGGTITMNAGGTSIYFSKTHAGGPNVFTGSAQVTVTDNVGATASASCDGEIDFD